MRECLADILIKYVQREKDMLYVYQEPMLHFGWLRSCLNMDNERLSQMAEVQATTAFESSPLRTHDPEKARLFFIPLWEWTSLRTGRCRNTTHQQRIVQFADALQRSKWFNRHGGRDHLWISSASRATVWEANGDFTLNRARKNRLRAAWPLLMRTTPGLRKVEEFSRAYEVPYGTPPPFSAHNNRARAVYFAGSFDVCCVGRAVRCRLASMYDQTRSIVLRRLAIGQRSVHFAQGKPIQNRCGANIPAIDMNAAIVGMRTHAFCLVPPGDNCVSARLYTAISQGCIPIILCDNLRGAFHKWLPYSAFSLRLSQHNVSVESIQSLIDGTSLHSIRKMQDAVTSVQEDLIWSGRYTARHAMRAAMDAGAADPTRDFRAFVYTTTGRLRYATAFDASQITVKTGGREPFRGGDRELWLLDRLPVHHEHVLHVDGTDALPMCDAAHFKMSIARVLQNASQRDALVVGGEKRVWPRTVSTARYPRFAGGPMPYANIGVLGGASDVYFDVLNCMRILFAGFPRTCPEVRQFGVAMVPSMQSPRRFSDQSCYHTYIQQHADGQIPTVCPPLVVDTRADLVLNLPKVSQRFKDVVSFGETNTTPCVLHAPGSSKWRIKELDDLVEKSRARVCRQRYQEAMHAVPAGGKERRDYFRFRDLETCGVHSTHILHACPYGWCEKLAETPSSTRAKICLAILDNRAAHPGISIWRAFGAYHNYPVYVQHPKPTDAKRRGERIMRADWQSTLHVRKVSTYASCDFVVYVEADQWPVRPTRRLEPFIQHAFADRRTIMAVNGEYPCMNARKGGRFNMGTYIVRAHHQDTDALLEKWANSTFHGGSAHSKWPARQGAFSDDPQLYDALSSKIYVFPTGCFAASPFATGIGHATSGIIPNVYSPRFARLFVYTRLHQCIRAALVSHTDAKCALRMHETHPTI